MFVYRLRPMLWKFAHETVEDQAGRMHRPGCKRLATTPEIERHAAGTALRRDIAPQECWACRPQLEMVLGV
jgi:hypothetical protein